MSVSRTSIALATYQGARFLPIQLESYAKQSRLPDELVISDDGSTDGTAEIVEDFRRTAPFPVIFIQNSGKRGINQNFQNAVLHCTNDIILLSDQDDQWLPDHVKRLVEMLESDSRITSVSSNSEIVDDDLQPKGYTLEHSERYPRKLHEAMMRFPKNQLELVIRHRILAGHGMAFRKKLVPALVPFTEHCLYDCWIYLLAASFGPVAYITEPLTLYRTHSRQTMGGEKKPIAAVAEKLSRTSAFADEAPRWRHILERLREFPDFAEDFAYSERLLQQKIDFITQRSRNRRAGLPQRLVGATGELLRGRYHHLGRGFVTYGRDLYGNR